MDLQHITPTRHHMPPNKFPGTGNGLHVFESLAKEVSQTSTLHPPLQAIPVTSEGSFLWHVLCGLFMAHAHDTPFIPHWPCEIVPAALAMTQSKEETGEYFRCGFSVGVNIEVLVSLGV